MASSLSNLVNNLAEEIYKIKYGHDDKKCKTYEFKYNDFDCCLAYANVKDDLIEYKCCNKDYQKKFDKT